MVVVTMCDVGLRSTSVQHIFTPERTDTPRLQQVAGLRRARHSLRRQKCSGRA